MRELTPPLKIRKRVLPDIPYRDHSVTHWEGKPVRLVLPVLPMTVNHMFGRNGTTSRYFLKDEVHVFRNLVRICALEQKFNFKPRALWGAHIRFKSPLWVTRANCVARKDCDNRVKPVFDALEKVLGLKDDRVWEFSVQKIASERESTEILLYDLGDVVDYLNSHDNTSK